jgi:methylenetetrahydrofolate--tRNA-(uracil-5-)-methyltransferase
VTKPVHIIGAGMAGSEAAWQIANAGVPVILHEMRPVRKTEAHSTENFAELVCSNSFRSDDHEYNAVGLLHEEMRRANSIIMQMGDEHKVPAGSALAVDRDLFSQGVTEKLMSHPLISVERGEIAGLPPEEWDNVIISTGPLTSPALADAVRKISGEEQLAFFDAIAPIVFKESIDMNKAWFQSRYDKAGPCGDGKDYINCPMEKDEYYAFVDALLKGDKTEFKEWEKDTPYFEACLPIEIMAERGPETLRFGPMKAIGLENPHPAPFKRPWAVVQLRQDNKLGTLYNIVGFQTKLKYGAQQDIFRMIPGLENAEFARLGGIHRNTFINSPKLLDATLRLKVRPSLRFAGQVTGCEGYVESAAVGLMAGRFAAAQALGQNIQTPPVTTAMGALLNHITTGANAETFQPMNINFGLFPPVDAELAPGKKKVDSKDRKKLYTSRALNDFDGWIKEQSTTGAVRAKMAGH